jgi:hypothetical protein
MDHVSRTDPVTIQLDVAPPPPGSGTTAPANLHGRVLLRRPQPWLSTADGHDLAGAVGFYGNLTARGDWPGPLDRAAELKGQFSRCRPVRTRTSWRAERRLRRGPVRDRRRARDRHVPGAPHRSSTASRSSIRRPRTTPEADARFHRAPRVASATWRSFAGLVRRARARAAVARNPRSVRDPGLRGDAPADAGRGSCPAISVARPLADGRIAGRRHLRTRSGPGRAQLNRRGLALHRAAGMIVERGWPMI